MIGRLKWPVILGGLLLVIACDRGYWAQVAQWREDQACQLWIGYTQPILKMPVGLISSVRTPNPNGMPLLSVVLSELPDLSAISTVLGFVQGALIVWVCWLIAGPGPALIALAVPALACVVLRATSVEYWNNWILASCNLAFFGLWIAYVRRRNPWLIVGCVVLMLWAPAEYLAGLVNAVVYFAVVAVTLWKCPPRVNLRRCIAPLLSALVVMALFLAVTWLPYARAMKGQHLPVPKLTLDVAEDRVTRSLEAALEFPRWTLSHWYRHADESILQSDRDILGTLGTRLLHQSRLLLWSQGVVLLVTLLLGVVQRLRRRAVSTGFFVEGSELHGRFLLAALAFVLIAMMVSPLIGGPSWTLSERPDQQVQFLPFMLLAWFSLPFVVQLPMWTRRVLRGATAVLALAFTLVNVVSGFQIVEAHLHYNGPTLSIADVPLKHQHEAIRFIANDWKAVSKSDRIPVSYQHGQDWVIEFGEQLLRWYPAPMIVGRAFDYELRRIYGLHNTQEGVQRRSSDQSRYIVTYAFRPPPSVGRAKATHHAFGRVRVSVVERGAGAR